MKVELQKDTISKILKNTTNGGFNVPSASENGKAAWEAQKNDIEYQELQLKSIQDAIRSFGAPNQAGLNLIPEAAAAANAARATRVASSPLAEGGGARRRDTAITVYESVVDDPAASVSEE